jgi:class 3 adenylate cyclase/tetratricopeptide (TPR) repeat protein
MPADAAAYLIREVVDRALEPGGSELGALRDLVPVFLQFQGFDFAPGRLDLARFHAFFSAVMELTHRYLGRLNRISMGDKGSTFLVLFGAPAPIEKAELLAAQWGVELLDRVRTEFPGVTLRAGLHTGRAFTGIVGGDGRWDYTVMGDAVNTAARLMGEAGDGGVAVSEPFRKRTSGAFEFADGGERALKGKQKTVRVHYLLGRRERDLRRAAPRAIGRERELGRLHEFLAGVRGGEPRLALLAGEAGTGTSLLAAQLAEEAGAGGWLAVIGRGEITTASHPYGPWMDLLRALLFGCLEPTAGALRERMARAGLDWGADGPTLRRFFGLPGGAGSAGDPAAEQRRTHDLLARLILDAARRRPTLLWLDDLHWFDSLSIELLRVLLGRFKDEPLAVLASTRPCPAAEALGGAFATGRTLTLGPLDAAGVRALAEERLEGEAREDLVGFLLARAAGNPFFTDRLIAYLREAELLDRRPDGWTAARRASELRLETGGEIVAAAVERLPASCRLHLQWAACMGPTIDPVVLERALGGRWDPSALEHLLDRGVLVREGPRRVRFAQGVLQEALYAAQLARVRQAAHRRIGRAMEEVAGEDASAMAPNLSNHYFLGGIRDRAAVHALAAARALWASGSYPEAHRFFARAWALRRRRGGDDRWEAGVWTGRAALAAGRMGEGLAHVRAFRRAALRAGRSREAEEALLQEFHLRHRQGDQGYAGHARRLARSGAAPHGRARELAYLIGAARFRQGRYEEARSWLRQAARSGRAGARESALSALLFLASIEKQGRRWGAALAALRRGMALAGRAGLEAARLKFVMEEANLLIERGAPADGRRLLMDSLPAIERTGDAYLLAVTLLNLGFLELQTGSVDAADRSLEEASRLFGNLGVPNGRAKALMNRGIGAFSGGRPDEAIRFYVEATRSYEGLGEEVEAVYGYYNLAEACLALGRTEEAEAWVRKAEAHGRVRADAALRGLFEGLRRQLGRS